MEPTLLMLDEPTNHLDLNAVIWLNKCVTFGYSLCVIGSHPVLVFSSCSHSVLMI